MGEIGYHFPRYALVAQLDRVPGYEPGGQRFESSPVHSIMKFQVFCFPSGILKTNSYLLVQPQGDVAVLIDPACGSSDEVIPFLKEKKIQLKMVLITHSHWDHIGDASVFKSEGCEVLIHEADLPNLQRPGADHLPCPIPLLPVEATRLLHDGDEIAIGQDKLKVIHTPGHTPGSLCFYDAVGGRLFSGDTLFRRSMGAISFPTSQPEKMWVSLQRLALLPAETEVFPGHGATTTIGKEYWLEKAESYFG
jgi:hydroxyacylglutathione hydrolase